MPSAAVSRAWNHHRAGRFAEAERLYREILESTPSDAEVLRLLGNVLRNTGRAQESVPTLQHAAELDPRNARVLLELGSALAEADRPGDAIAVLQQCIDAEPSRVEGYVRLAQAFMRLGQNQHAIKVVETGLQRKPNDAALLKAMGDALVNHSRLKPARSFYERVLAKHPTHPIAHSDLGNVLRSLGELDEAERHLATCLESAPQHVPAIAGMADILVSRDRATEAMDMLLAAHEGGNRHPDLAMTMSRVAKRLKQYDTTIRVFEETLEQPGLPVTYRATLNLAMGAALEANGAYDDAFARYEEGNSHFAWTFDPEAHTKSVDAMIDAFSKDAMATMPRASGDTARPIFIVGMPRSGTTLVEQILACHPDVHGAGELNEIERIASRLHDAAGVPTPYPTCVSALSQADIDDASSKFLAFLREIDSDAQHVTDKMPMNFAHLGLISILFPQAKIIHCTRDPRDICVSCYATTMSSRLAFSTDLRHLGVVYREYERLMAHWRDVLDVPILDVSYEAMVDDSDDMSRRIVEFCELPWTDACLRFYESGRVAQTPSIDQVAQPIYRSSIDRWKRFETHLGPLLESLG